MVPVPFYDPAKTYAENYEQGPFGEFAGATPAPRNETSEFEFCGLPIGLPLGIPAGPLVNGRFVKAALAMGYDVPVYKTVRTRKTPSHAWPNVLAVRAHGEIRPGGGPLVADEDYSPPLSITNSFGVPSMDPDVWQPDMAEAAAAAGAGQVVVGSYQGTKQSSGGAEAYIADFVRGAQLVKETGVKVVEVNLSCPNEGTSNLLCFDVERVQVIVEAIKTELGRVPLVIKIAYFATDEHLRHLLSAVGGTVEGIAAINTVPAEIINAHGQQALPGEGRLVSGVCGAGIRWAGLEMTQRLAALRVELALGFSILGTGGMMEPQDFAEYRKAGADVVMSATGAMWRPALAREIAEAQG